MPEPISISDEDARRVLSLPMQPNEAGASTVREYLKQLLTVLWEELDGFSGKRPFGDSDWQYDLYQPLVKAGLVEGEFDEDVIIGESVDTTRADAYIAAAVKAL